MRLTVHAGENSLYIYKFNKHRIKHQFCSTCGCQPFAFGQDPAGNEIAAINARCLEDIDLAAVPRQPYDGKHA
jgi:hypothetical protein